MVKFSEEQAMASAKFRQVEEQNSAFRGWNEKSASNALFFFLTLISILVQDIKTGISCIIMC